MTLLDSYKFSLTTIFWKIPPEQHPPWLLQLQSYIMADKYTENTIEKRTTNDTAEIKDWHSDKFGRKIGTIQRKTGDWMKTRNHGTPFDKGTKKISTLKHIVATNVGAIVLSSTSHLLS